MRHLYGRRRWVMEKEKNRNTLKRAQRAALIRSSAAYRTVSHTALCMLTGTLHIYYTVELRAEKYRIKKEYLQSRYEYLHTHSREDPASVFYARIKAVEDKWKDEWRNYRNDNWTKRLVADICTFKRHRRHINNIY
jgi:hypothetical protein